ncbi:MAG: GNAT family N-acetyltransferase [Acidimicrobiia bacterium]|nr:GNAT family N-acetyltransferase [Acidimicrobiia bacterium]
MKSSANRRPTVAVVASRSGLDDLGPEWDALWTSSPNATPYNHRHWVMTWLDHFQGRDKIHVVTVRDGGELVGVAPYVEARLIGSTGPLGFLVAAGAELADDGGPLLAGEAGLAGEALASYLFELVQRTTTSVIMPRLVDGGPIVPHLAAAGFDLVETASVARLSICFDRFDDPATSLARLAKKRDVPRNRRRLTERFEVDVSFDDDPRTAFDSMLELQKSLRDAEDEQGLFSTTRTRAFARDAVEKLWGTGVAKLTTLRADGRPFAVGLGYVAGGRYVGHKLTYDDEYKRYGPGQMLIHELASATVARALSEYDMGRGDSPYKRQWCNHERRVVSVALVRSDRLRRAQLLAGRLLISRRIRRLGRTSWE